MRRIGVSGRRSGGMELRWYRFRGDIWEGGYIDGDADGRD